MNCLQKNSKGTLTSIIGLVGIAILLSACGEGKTEEKKADSTNDVILKPEMMKSIKIDTCLMKNVNNQLNLTGKITFNQDKMVRAFSPVGGHIEDVKVQLGDYVKEGQTLAIIRSGDISDLSQQGNVAKSQLLVAQKNLQVTEDLAKSGLASQRDLITAREQVEQAKGEITRIDERRKLLGSSNTQYILKAPASGFVVEKSAAPGMELRSDASASLFTISNLDQVWVLANVYETDVAKVKVGVSANVTTISYPDKSFQGKIDKVFNTLDPDSKTEKVRVTLPNSNYLLKPEMFANVTLEFAGAEQKIAIPAKAIVFDNNRNYVVVYQNPEHISVKEVEIYKTIGDISYIDSGLKAGDRIISQNQLLIYNALNK